MKATINIIWPLSNAILLGYVFYTLDTRTDRAGRTIYAFVMLSITMNLLIKYIFKPAKNR